VVFRKRSRPGREREYIIRVMGPFLRAAAAALLLLASACLALEDQRTPPPNGAYKPCRVDTECQSTTPVCLDVRFELDGGTIQGAMCTLGCATETCPFGGVCLELGGSGALCYAQCSDDFDCPAGAECVPGVPNAPGSVCLPQG